MVNFREVNFRGKVFMEILGGAIKQLNYVYTW